jgi:hypothetical protein
VDDVFVSHCCAAAFLLLQVLQQAEEDLERYWLAGDDNTVVPSLLAVAILALN